MDEKKSARLLKETFCYYCQQQFANPRNLQRHVSKIHPGSYADNNIKAALAMQENGFL